MVISPELVQKCEHRSSAAIIVVESAATTIGRILWHRM